MYSVKTKIRFALGALLLLAYPSQAWIYVVKEHDKFSKIAGKYISGPVWGTAGSFKVITQLNPHLKDPYRILPGDQIVVPEEQVATQVLPSIQLDRKPSQLETPGDQSSTWLVMTPSFSMTQLSATDRMTSARSRISSNLFLSLKAEHFQGWNEKTETFLRGQISYVSFVPPSGGSKTLTNSSGFRTELGAGVSRRLSDRLKWGLLFKLDREFFVTASSTSAVAIESILIPALGLDVSYDLAKLNAFTLTLYGNYEQKWSAAADNFQVQKGSAFSGRIGVRPANQRTNMFEVQLGSQYRSQNTSLTTQSELMFTGGVQIYFLSDQSRIGVESTSD